MPLQPTAPVDGYSSRHTSEAFDEERGPITSPPLSTLSSGAELNPVSYLGKAKYTTPPDANGDASTNDPHQPALLEDLAIPDSSHLISHAAASSLDHQVSVFHLPSDSDHHTPPRRTRTPPLWLATVPSAVLQPTWADESLADARELSRRREVLEERRAKAEAHYHRDIWVKDAHDGPYRRASDKLRSGLSCTSRAVSHQPCPPFEGSSASALTHPGVNGPSASLGFEVVRVGPTSNFVGDAMATGAVDLVMAELDETGRREVSGSDPLKLIMLSEEGGELMGLPEGPGAQDRSSSAEQRMSRKVGAPITSVMKAMTAGGGGASAEELRRQARALRDNLK